MSLLVYEDIYMAIYRTDGHEAAMQLRDRVLAGYQKGRGLHCYRNDLKGYDIWEPTHIRRRIDPKQVEKMDNSSAASVGGRPPRYVK